MPGDGNCFFHAVAYSCDEDQTGPVLRRRLVEYMRQSHASQYADFIQRSPRSPRAILAFSKEARYNSYTERLEQGAWAEHIAVQATADMLNVEIRVFNTISPEYIHTIVPRSGNATKQIYLGLINETHYVVFERIANVRVTHIATDTTTNNVDIADDHVIESNLSQTMENCRLGTSCDIESDSLSESTHQKSKRIDHMDKSCPDILITDLHTKPKEDIPIDLRQPISCENHETKNGTDDRQNDTLPVLNFDLDHPRQNQSLNYQDHDSSIKSNNQTVNTNYDSKPLDSNNDNTYMEDKEDKDAFHQSTRLRGLPYSTLLQEEFSSDDTIAVAPSEREHPISLLNDHNFEELAFPDKFPYGRGGNSMLRQNTMTTRRYFNQRLLHVDGRFAKDIDYLLAAQYAVEAKQVNDCINIALRQTRGRTFRDRQLNAGIVKNADNISTMIRTDAAFRFMKNVRGSPSYWKTVMFDLLAMVRQLGIPTWFLTLSAADLKWPEVIQSIAKQYGTTLSVEDIKHLSWEEKCKWLRTNPVTAARMFQFRLETFFKEVLMSDAQPLGDLQDFMIRIEFQNRGSPHAHCLLFIREPKQLNVDSDNDVANFISQYQTCRLPNNDPELRELVTSLQRHRHSAACRRGNDCRFRFPHAPSSATVIARPAGDDVDPQRANLQLKRKTEVISLFDPINECVF